jgi:hypothetical protein
LRKRADDKDEGGRIKLPAAVKASRSEKSSDLFGSKEDRPGSKSVSQSAKAICREASAAYQETKVFRRLQARVADKQSVFAIFKSGLPTSKGALPSAACERRNGRKKGRPGNGGRTNGCSIQLRTN